MDTDWSDSVDAQADNKIRWVDISMCWSFNCARNRFGIVKYWGLNSINSMFSVPWKSTMSKTCCFVHIKRQFQLLSYKGANYQGMHEALPGYLHVFPCSPEINHFVPPFSKIKIFVSYNSPKLPLFTCLLICRSLFPCSPWINILIPLLPQTHGRVPYILPWSAG